MLPLAIPGHGGADAHLVLRPGARPPSQEEVAVLTAALYELLSPARAGDRPGAEVAAWRFSTRWWHDAQNGRT